MSEGSMLTLSCLYRKPMMFSYLTGIHMYVGL